LTKAIGLPGELKSKPGFIPIRSRPTIGAVNRPVRLTLLAVTVLAGVLRLSAQQVDPRHPPLASSDIDDIATLLRLEDTRAFDGEILGRLAHSKHPEVQRRAFVSLGRIVSDESRALVAQLRTEFGVSGVNAVSLAFASGQLKDPKAVSWLGDALDRASVEMSVAATRALGEIRTPEARAVLAGYLNRASRTASGQPGVGEALLSLGRFTDKGADLAPIVRFITSPDPEIRWRVAWALFRPRDPAALPYLQDLLADPSPEVRFWAVRGLAPAVVDQAGGDRAKTSALIRPLVHDSDRRVQTEALRALLQFDDAGAFAELLAALKSPDTWLSTSAAENAMRFQSRAVEYGDVTALILDQACLLQSSRGFHDPLSSHSQHVCDELLRHLEFARAQAIETQ